MVAESVLILEWYPAAGGAPLTARGGPSTPLRLLTLDGTGPTSVQPLMTKAPGQAGETALDAIVGPRVVTAQFLLQEADPWAQRAALAKALVQQPVRPGGTLALGRLRATRQAPLPPLELEAMPRNSPAFTILKGGALHLADVEWYCPMPYWSETVDTALQFEQAGGFTFPEDFVLQMDTFNIEQEVVNAGDVDAPILARIYGNVTTARMRNVTSGEELEVTGAVAAGEYVEVNTSFGAKRVDLVTIADGSRVSILDRLNLNKADFWQLRPGANTVIFEADINVSGRADLYYRQRFGGL